MKIIFSTILLSMTLLINAQENRNLLVNKTFTANIGSICEETPDGYDCSDIEIYLILNFAKENVSIIEKEISNCGTENITFKFDYKWKLTQNSEIKIVSNPKGIKYNFLKGLTLKIENKKVIGYKKRNKYLFTEDLKQK